MRVLHVTPYFAPAFVYGGPPRSVLGLCRALRRAGAQVDVVTTTANGSALAAEIRLDSIEVGPIVMRNVRALVARPGALEQSLLGMSFLERLKSYTVERGRLILSAK